VNKPLNQEQLKELVSITSEKLGIKYPSIIEKDYYVTHIIHALSSIENEYFRLIFAGGTCLAKAHKIVKRMSEDVDFKIQFKQNGNTFSKNRLLKELKKFRSQIISSLVLPDLTISDTAVRNEGQYLRAELTYPTLFTASDTLRPHLLLEFTLSDVRLPTENLSINSIIEDVIEIDALFSPSFINCVSADETAIEKWVSLTRRISAIEREYDYDDPTLVRHIYDLHAIKQANRINDIFFSLAKTIVNYDAKQFKNQHPEYFSNSCTEICRSLEILKNKELWKERYQKFIDSMVYDTISSYDYDSALSMLESISKKIIISITQPIDLINLSGVTA
jgi:predicted nucleotidyltransferase component of viral defense system